MAALQAGFTLVRGRHGGQAPFLSAEEGREQERHDWAWRVNADGTVQVLVPGAAVHGARNVVQTYVWKKLKPVSSTVLTGYLLGEVIRVNERATKPVGKDLRNRCVSFLVAAAAYAKGQAAREQRRAQEAEAARQAQLELDALWAAFEPVRRRVGDNAAVELVVRRFEVDPYVLFAGDNAEREQRADALRLTDWGPVLERALKLVSPDEEALVQHFTARAAGVNLSLRPYQGKSLSHKLTIDGEVWHTGMHGVAQTAKSGEADKLVQAVLNAVHYIAQPSVWSAFVRGMREVTDKQVKHGRSLTSWLGLDEGCPPNLEPSAVEFVETAFLPLMCMARWTNLKDYRRLVTLDNETKNGVINALVWRFEKRTKEFECYAAAYSSMIASQKNDTKRCRTKKNLGTARSHFEMHVRLDIQVFRPMMMEGASVCIEDAKLFSSAMALRWAGGYLSPRRPADASNARVPEFARSYTGETCENILHLNQGRFQMAVWKTGNSSRHTADLPMPPDLHIEFYLNSIRPVLVQAWMERNSKPDHMYLFVAPSGAPIGGRWADLYSNFRKQVQRVLGVDASCFIGDVTCPYDLRGIFMNANAMDDSDINQLWDEGERLRQRLNGHEVTGMLGPTPGMLAGMHLNAKAGQTGMANVMNPYSFRGKDEHDLCVEKNYWARMSVLNRLLAGGQVDMRKRAKSS